MTDEKKFNLLIENISFENSLLQQNVDSSISEL